MSATATPPVTDRDGPIPDVEFAACQSMLVEGESFATKVPPEGEEAWEPVGGLRLIGGSEGNGFLRLWRRLREDAIDGSSDKHKKRSKSSGDMFEYFACGEIVGTDAATMYCVGQDCEHRMFWDAHAVAIERLEKYQDGCECLYWAVKFPWPLTNRDYVYFRRSQHDVERGIFYQVSIGGEHPLKPPTKKLVRVDTYMNKMAMRQKGHETVEFVLRYADDLKGSIPKSMVNWAVETAVPQFMTQLRQVCLEYPPERVTLFTESDE